MTIITKNINIYSKGENGMIGPTSEAVQETKLKHGIVTIFVAGSTTAVTTIEYEPRLRIDFPKMLSRIAPKDLHYEHDKRGIIVLVSCAASVVIGIITMNQCSIACNDEIPGLWTN
ncbi:MAG: YjbQ family protein [Candidatus Nitrosopolaris sp.]